MEYRVSNHNDMSAVLYKLYQWDTNQIRGLHRSATFGQLIALYHDFGSELADAIRVAKATGRYVPMPRGTAALAVFLTGRISPEDCDFFWRKLREGTDLDEGDPILVLRNTLLANAAQGPSRGRYTAPMLLALIIKAWNAYRAGERINQLRWRAGGSRPEPFPEPK